MRWYFYPRDKSTNKATCTSGDPFEVDYDTLNGYTHTIVTPKTAGQKITCIYTSTTAGLDNGIALAPSVAINTTEKRQTGATTDEIRLATSSLRCETHPDKTIAVRTGQLIPSSAVMRL